VTVAACSDGVDNDGDGLADQVDPGCSGYDDNDERQHHPRGGPAPAPLKSNFAFVFATEGMGVYISSLHWKGIPVIVDPGAKGSRFFLHSDSDSAWASGVQTFEKPLKNDPYQEPPFPWS
jgi:hypothetical protein